MEKISNRQIVLIGVLFTYTATIINIEAPVAYYAKQQAWIPHVLAALIIWGILWLLTKTLSRFPKQDLFEIMTERFPIAGRVITFGYILFVLMIAARDMRMLVDFTNVVLLPATPLTVIAALVAVSAIAVARGGIQSVARMTELYAPVLIIIALVLPFLVAKDFQVAYLLPLSEFEIPGISIGIWLVLPFIGEIVLIAFLCVNRSLPFRLATTSLSIGTLLLVLLIFEQILLLGIPLTSRLIYPALELIRSIRITDFLDRLDLILVTLWLPTIITKISVCLYIVCHGIKRMLPQASAKILTIPCGYFLFVCSLWFFKNAVQLVNFVSQTWPAIAILFEVILPCCMFLFLKPTAKLPDSP